ncbi:restriction endonuclease [Thermodesulfobacteriota bacterium]
MAIPDYQSIMLPLLKYASDEKEHSLRETIEALADQYKLTDDERKELLPSGQQSTFDNRVGWARTYLVKAKLLEKTRRGYFRIAARGKEVLSDNPEFINVAFLKQFPETLEFINPKHDKDPVDDKDDKGDKTPGELIESAYQRLRQDLIDEILQNIKGCSPAFFEKLVVDLLVKMGYGGTRKDAGQAVGKSGDGGIDGIIKEDRLGLDVIYIQAKRWENVVGRPEIQKFAGALQGHRARKGVFITTSSFTSDALEYVSKIDSKIVLIDGNTVAQFMIDHNVGVSSVAAYEIKKADSDYFIED